jgi:hypothetical protein
VSAPVSNSDALRDGPIQWISDNLRRRVHEVAESEAAQNARPVASGIEVRTRRLLAGAVGFSPEYGSEER